MGMLYYQCKKCKGCFGVFGHYVGHIKCETCDLIIQKDKGHYFKKHYAYCPECNFTVTYESMDENIDVRCVNCDVKMLEPKIRLLNSKSVVEKA